MREIQLSKGCVALVDDEDYDSLMQWKWCASFNNNGYGYARRTDYSKGRRNPIKIKMHRLIIGAEKGDFVDHLNRNTFDNRKENLRITTPSGNSHNSKKREANKSGYWGVTYVPHLNKTNPYISKIGVDGERKYLGYFKTAEEAARMYDAAAIVYFGEYANLNNVEVK